MPPKVSRKAPRRSSSPEDEATAHGAKRVKVDSEAEGGAASALSKREVAAARKAAAQAAKEKASAEAEESLRSWIAANDELLCSDLTVTIDQLFTKAVKYPDFSTGGTERKLFDWSAFRSILEGRGPSSPDTLFIQCRQDDLVMEPDGLTGITVDNFVVVSAATPTLAPRHYIVRDHRPFSDIEDNAPERVKDLKAQNARWIPVVHSDQTSAKCYLLHRPDEVAAWSLNREQTAARVGSFNFGFSAVPPPPAAQPEKVSESAAATDSSNSGFNAFSFGRSPSGNSLPAASASFSFGFGATVQPPQSSASGGELTAVPPPGPLIVQPPHTSTEHRVVPTFSFGFGAPAPLPQPTGGELTAVPPPGPLIVPAPPSFEAGGSAGFSALQKGSTDVTAADSLFAKSISNFGTAEQQLKVSQLCFTLWSTERVREMRKCLKAGTRIVRPDFPLDDHRKMKIVMQSDMSDSVEDTVNDLLLKAFAKSDKELLRLDQWISECPRYNEKLQTALQKFRSDVLHETGESKEFTDFKQKYERKVLEELNRIVELRKAEVAREDELLSQVADQLKAKKIAEKKEFTVWKYYPSNAICRFRPHGKVTGITEAGETAHCEPPAYVFVNPLLARP